MQINLNSLCRLWIPRVTDSNNVMLRMHHMARHKLNDTWIWEVRSAINDWEHTHGQIPMTGWGKKRRVKIVSHRKNQVDEDNLTGGMKPLIDAMVHHRLLWNDTPKDMELSVDQVLDRDNVGTYIEVSL